MSCYTYIVLDYKNGLFDKWIDMCYILTMENSDRMPKFMKQLDKYNLLSKCTIQVNKGYKDCKKHLYKQSSIQDLNESYYKVFQNAKENNYKNIMVLEDDFFFEDLNENIAESIGTFIANNYYHIYNLGPLGHISIPSFDVHHKSIVLTTAHGVIYSNHYVDYYINNYLDAMKYNPDLYWNKAEIIKYKYYKPLCFQTFPNKSSQDHWEIPKWFLNIAVFGIKLVELDVKHQPGFAIFNILGYMPFIIVFVLAINIICRLSHKT